MDCRSCDIFWKHYAIRIPDGFMYKGHEEGNAWEIRGRSATASIVPFVNEPVQKNGLEGEASDLHQALRQQLLEEDYATSGEATSDYYQHYYQHQFFQHQLFIEETSLLEEMEADSDRASSSLLEEMEAASDRMTTWEDKLTYCCTMGDTNEPTLHFVEELQAPTRPFGGAAQATMEENLFHQTTRGAACYQNVCTQNSTEEPLREEGSTMTSGPLANHNSWVRPEGGDNQPSCGNKGRRHLIRRARWEAKRVRWKTTSAGDSCQE